MPAAIVNGRRDSFCKWPDFQVWKASDLDLGSGHTAYLRASLIDLYLRAKFHWNRRNILWTDGRTDGRMHGRTFEMGFIRSTACYLVCVNNDWQNVAIFGRQQHDTIRECNSKALVFIMPLQLANCHCHTTHKAPVFIMPLQLADWHCQTTHKALVFIMPLQLANWHCHTTRKLTCI